MIAKPLLSTRTPGGTVTTTPPMTARTLISVTGGSRVDRRSISIPPMTATALIFRGTVHTPRRTTPLISAKRVR
jgi:hypothetical protein